MFFDYWEIYRDITMMMFMMSLVINSTEKSKSMTVELKMYSN